MITIIKGQRNEICVTLAERASGTVLFTLAVFKSEDSGEELSCIAEDTFAGDSPSRYYQINIVEQSSVTTADRLAGKISLNPKGRFYYKLSL